MIRRIGLCLAIVTVGLMHPLAQTNKEVATKTSPVPKPILDTNSAVKVNIPQGSRVMLREVTVFVDGSGDDSLRAFVEPMIKSMLNEAGLVIVVTPQELQREIQERKSDRESEEIHKSSLPAKGTILRESVELKVTVHLARSSKQIGALLGELSRRRINIGGFAVRKKETVCIVLTEFVDNATQTTIAQLISFATEKDETLALTGTPFGGFVTTRDNQRQRDMKALQASLTYLKGLLKLKLSERNPIKGKVLGKVEGITTTFIAINVGRIDGVQKGVVFSVHPIRTVGGEQVTLPQIAKLRALTVNDANTVCDVIEGKLDDISEGDEVQEIINLLHDRR